MKWSAAFLIVFALCSFRKRASCALCGGGLMNKYDDIDCIPNSNLSINAEATIAITYSLEGSDRCVVACLTRSHGLRVGPFILVAAQKRRGHEFERHVDSFHSINSFIHSTHPILVLETAIFAPFHPCGGSDNQSYRYKAIGCDGILFLSDKFLINDEKKVGWETMLIVAFSPNGIL